MASDEVKPSSIPSYPEMILGAIEASEEKDGSNKTAISDYIEGKYGELLPESHVSLLSAHLERMKESGEITMIKNNYTKPLGPDAPPKRGRGRPPKPKDPLAAAVTKAASGLPRPRGRPPKKARPAGDAESAAAGDAESAGAGEGPAPAAASPAAAPVSGAKRGRGRPPKVKPQFADVGFA